MLESIIAKAEKASAWAGRYFDLDRAARWRKPALVAGTMGWAGRWALVALLSYDAFNDPAAASEIADGMAAPDAWTLQKTMAYGAAIALCMAIKWAGWTYGGLGYVHHRSRKAQRA